MDSASCDSYKAPVKHALVMSRVVCYLAGSISRKARVIPCAWEIAGHIPARAGRPAEEVETVGGRGGQGGCGRGWIWKQWRFSVLSSPCAASPCFFTPCTSPSEIAGADPRSTAKHWLRDMKGTPLYPLKPCDPSPAGYSVPVFGAAQPVGGRGGLDWAVHLIENSRMRCSHD